MPRSTHPLKLVFTSLIPLLGMTHHNAFAYEQGDWVVRAGYAAVDPRDNSGDLKLKGNPLNGTGAGVDSDSALGLSISYMVSSTIGIEILAATPFKHAITSKGLSGFGVPDGARLGETKQLPPTISAQYYFASAESAWQPYAGIGINYTSFFDEKLSLAAKEQLGASHLKLKDSWGLALELGMDWRINERWLLNAAIWRMDIDSDASLDTALGKVKTHVNIDPWVYMLGVGYKF